MSKDEKKKAVDEEVKEAEQTQEESCEEKVEEKKEPTLEEQLADMKKQLAYTAAEYANFRARSAKEKEATYSNAKGNVVS